MLNSLYNAFLLLISFDREVYFIIYTSIYTTFFSTIFASIIGIPLAFYIDIAKPRIKKLVISILNSLMAIPTVVIGLFVYSLIYKKGILGNFSLLYTPLGIIIGQTILGIPIITSMIVSGFSKIDLRLYETLITLGSNKKEILLGVIRETQYLILSSVLVGFGRIIGEVGISMMLGGNIKWFTRTLTTAIALETNKGNFSYALALGIVLIIIAFFINFLSNILFAGKFKWKMI